MLSKKIRTEYMKKFKEPKWETFSKCYEESVKYRLTRRVMEHAHKPLWFWEGWDTSTGSDSSASGRSTPKMRNKVVPVDGAVGEAAAQNRMAAESTTDEGPAEKTSSDEEPAKEPKRRHRTPRAELCHRDGSRDEIRPGPVRKPSRAKSQPPALTTEKENQRSSARLDWSERQASSARSRHLVPILSPVNLITSCASLLIQSRTSDTFVQSRRGSNKRATNLDRRRARSADLEKIRQAELTVVDDRWMTEYMRCFSARLR
uniref:Centriole, cilia and spindle-associated protein a n=1 Tax=Esox lucius TaxID=8010 RepID=A0A3P8Y182_ESOLU